jgi:hypothetical protein
MLPRRSRLSLPRVNQNPRPPNDRNRQRVGGSGGRLGRPAAPGSGFHGPGQGQANHFGGPNDGRPHIPGDGRDTRNPRDPGQWAQTTPGTTPTDFTTPPTVVAEPGGDMTYTPPTTAPPNDNPLNLNLGAFKLPAWTGTGPDPRDATYWNNVASLLFTSNREYGALQQAGIRGDTDYKQGLAQMLVERERERESLNAEAIRSGLTHSGYVDSTDARDTREYLSERGEFDIGYQRSRQDREQALQDLLQGFSLEAGGELTDAVNRLAGKELDDAATGEPIGPAATANALEKPPPKALRDDAERLFSSLEKNQGEIGKDDIKRTINKLLAKYGNDYAPYIKRIVKKYARNHY